MLSPTASNAPGRSETHPAAWNVPVGVGGGEERQAVRGAAEGWRWIVREVTGLGGGAAGRR